MPIALASFGFIIAALAAGAMGFAIQRGATCTVAAVDEVVRTRRVKRLAAIFEASLWVLGGLAVAQVLDLLPTMPMDVQVTAGTFFGGVLLGTGAWMNRACVFGTIARLGSGEWSYAVTPLGFYSGCLAFASVVRTPSANALPDGSPVFAMAPAFAFLFVAVALWRCGRQLMIASRSGPGAASIILRLREAVTRDLWSPHAATTVIGVTFLVLLLMAGAWTYTDVLAELARGMANNILLRALLLLALFAGAFVGGWTAGRLRNTPITARGLARCFGGGMLMGWGSLWIPGGNDGLILVGMPLLWPYAWTAFLTMCAAIGAAMLAQRALAARRLRRLAS
jgi:toxin CptA